MGAMIPPEVSLILALRVLQFLGVHPFVLR